MASAPDAHLSFLDQLPGAFAREVCPRPLYDGLHLRPLHGQQAGMYSEPDRKLNRPDKFMMTFAKFGHRGIPADHREDAPVGVPERTLPRFH